MVDSEGLVKAGWVHDLKLYQFKTKKFVVVAKGQAVISIKHRKKYSYFLSSI